MHCAMPAGSCAEAAARHRRPAWPLTLTLTLTLILLSVVSPRSLAARACAVPVGCRDRPTKYLPKGGEGKTTCSRSWG